jgi:hypothetical protein
MLARAMSERIGEFSRLLKIIGEKERFGFRHHPSDDTLLHRLNLHQDLVETPRKCNMFRLANSGSPTAEAPLAPKRQGVGAACRSRALAIAPSRPECSNSGRVRGGGRRIFRWERLEIPENQ